MPPNTVKVDRTTRWGNPFRDSENGRIVATVQLANGMLMMVPDWWTAAATVQLYEQWLTGQQLLDPYRPWPPHIVVKREQLRPVPDLAPLRGKHLACWCKQGSACHAGVLLRLANEGAAA